MPEELTATQREIMNYVARHIVSLRGKYRKTGEALTAMGGTPFNYSGFIFNLRDDWFLLTAGHILQGIADARAANMIVDDFRLDDGYAPNAPFKDSTELIPFDFNNAPKHFVDQPKLGDYGSIQLRHNYRELLRKNNIEPFSPREMATTADGTGFVSYWLIGLPSELMNVEGEGNDLRQKSQLVIIKVVPAAFDELPDSVKSSVQDGGFRTDNFFACIPDASELTNNEEPGLQSIVGMSGGPIIGWRRNSNGVLGYTLIAMQSRWWDKSRIIMACPAARYIFALDQTIQAVGYPSVC